MKYFLLSFLLSPVILTAQSDSIRFKLVKSLTQDIYQSYLDAEIAKVMCDTIKYKLSAGKYDSTFNLDEFVFEVAQDMRRISKDKHIVVIPAHYKQPKVEYRTISYNHSRAYYKRHDKKAHRRSKRAYARSERIRKKNNRLTNHDMFTYGEIKILPGNIGYVEVKDFHGTSSIKKENKHRISFHSVLSFLRNTNSIILDFRENTGGLIFLSARLCAYFSDTAASYFITTVSTSRYDSSGITKEDSFKKEFHTDSNINNKLTENKKLFILTSKRTFSAGELSTYKLKQLHSNTTIVGEKTAGAANGHFGGSREEYYYAVIPCMRVFDERNSNYTFEGKGIEPDIQTISDSALSVAYKLSLPSNFDTGKIKTKYYKKQELFFDEREELYRKKYDDFVGNYRKIIITKENEKLVIIYDTFTKQILVPDAPDFFLTDGFEFVRFKRNEENKIIEIQIKHKDGYVEKFRRQYW